MTATDVPGPRMTSVLIDGSRIDAAQAGLLVGFVGAMRQAHADWHLTVALNKAKASPLSLEGLAKPFYLPHVRELFWPCLARNFDLFVSLDAELPLLPMPCPMVHVVHEGPFPRGPGRFRLRRALATARLTWFDSLHVQQACEAWSGQPTQTGVVRPSHGLDNRLHDLETILGCC